MSVPTFTSITPNAGTAQGRFLAVINGSNFRIPDSPPATGFVGGAESRTLKVEIDGVEADRAFAMSVGKIAVLIPDYRGAADIETIPTVDVTITNLDNNGDPIAGETVTAVGAFSFERPQIDGQTDLTRLVREVLRVFKRQILTNVVMTTHTDYDDTTGDDLNIIALAKLPGIVITGPDLVLNTFYREQLGSLVQDGREFARKKSSRTVDLVFEFVGAADRTTHLINLMNTVGTFFEKNKFIRFDRDGDDPGVGSVQYEMELTTDPAVQSRANESNVRHFVGAFEIRAFDIELDTISKTWEVDDLTTDGEVDQQLEKIEESV